MKDRGLCLQCMCTVFSVNISKVSDWLYQNMNTSVCIKKLLIVFFSRDVYTLYLYFSGFSHRNTSLIYYKKTALGLKILYTFQYSLIKLI